MTLKIKKRDIMTTVCFLVCIFSFQYAKFFGTSLFLNKLFVYLPFLVASVYLVYVLSHRSNKEDKLIGKLFLNLFVPYLIFLLVIELLAFAFNSDVIETYGLSYWTRLVSNLLGRCGPIILAYSCLVSNRRRCLKCMINAFIIDGILVIVNAIIKCGLIETLAGFLYPFGFTAGETGAGYMEVHEATYAIGLIILYGLFFNKEVNRKALLFLIFLFIIGNKRIGFLAFVVAVVFYLIFRKNISRKTLVVLSLIGIIVPVLYLYLIYNNGFIALMNAYGVNVMGRDVIYLYFTNRSKFALNYVGSGFASTSKMIENMSRTEVGNMVNVRGIHNDYLKLYFEYGFWGFIVWLVYNLYFIARLINKYFGNRSLKMYIGCLIFAFITYLTDNTEGYPVFQTVLFLLPVLCSNFFIEKEKQINNK